MAFKFGSPPDHLCHLTFAAAPATSIGQRFRFDPVHPCWVRA